jgi:hypothetical protein
MARAPATVGVGGWSPARETFARGDDSLSPQACEPPTPRSMRPPCTQLGAGRQRAVAGGRGVEIVRALA